MVCVSPSMSFPEPLPVSDAKGALEDTFPKTCLFETERLDPRFIA